VAGKTMLSNFQKKLSVQFLIR